ncbi:(d)CMP kinase [Mycoplasma putrefaciens]|uniref:Cytidylate kinase n=1 Tax=Mycoplasma putrefaciens (strain ATCC 15718 / NCTC 10155 / C30 KS-1 / KS-1) TaxID=743965 RepID=A0A7U4E9R5_MYCPK|nr:(d)CMP kinase [Mycoplasma putrefaciens]AEM68775.1 cytidylate kinase [Mycoplasma putrefaciens KS1]
MKKLIVAVDGTSGSGKSITFKKIADLVGYQFIDTGLMYRALTWFCLDHKIDYKNPANVINLLDKFDYQVIGDDIFVNQINITSKLQSNEIINAINYITPIKEVREFMVQKQRDMVKTGGYIEIGRDITSVVLPNADLKIYLDSSIETRAQRRFNQNKKNNITGKSYQEIKLDLENRDHIDKTRTTGPLTLVRDAWYIDNSDLTIDQVVKLVVDKIKKLERKL